jgi:hypothetical protein
MTLKQFPTGATISQKPKQRRLHVSYFDDDIPDLFRRLSDLHDYNLGETFTWMIEEVGSSDRLQNKVLAFLDRTEGFWIDSGKRKDFYITCGIEEDVRSLAETMAFALLGHGSLSELCRLLVRFYAVRNKLIEEPTRPPRASKKSQVKLKAENKVISISDKTAQSTRAKLARKVPTDMSVSFTIDKQTNEYIKRLVQSMEKKRMSVLRTIIEDAGMNEGKMKALQTFYNKEWSTRPPQGKVSLYARFNYSPQVDALLLYLSKRVTGKENKSRMIRVLVEFYYRNSVASA